MARIGLLHGIDRECANGINAKLDHRVVLLVPRRASSIIGERGWAFINFFTDGYDPPDGGKAPLRGNPQHRRRFQPDDRSRSSVRSIARDLMPRSLLNRLFRTREVESRVYKCNMRKCLWEIANQSLRVGVIFFGQKSDIVPERKQPLE